METRLELGSDDGSDDDEDYMDSPVVAVHPRDDVQFLHEDADCSDTLPMITEADTGGDSS